MLTVHRVQHNARTTEAMKTSSLVVGSLTLAVEQSLLPLTSCFLFARGHGPDELFQADEYCQSIFSSEAGTEKNREEALFTKQHTTQYSNVLYALTNEVKNKITNRLQLF